MGATLLTALVMLPARAADDAARLADLTAALALLGMPCGQVVSATRLKGDDHIAVCRDGNRYRVFVSAEGRVVAQKQ
jgi:hemin uptake protein HemP